MTLPPGRFAVKVVVRENASGAIGSFETAVFVPELKQAPVKVSSVVLSTQLQPLASKGRSDNPLVRDGMQIVPNVTHVVGRDQKLFFYFEVYEPALADAAPDVRTSLAFYRGKIKVFETPVVERVDARRARPQGRAVPVRSARGRVQARALHLPDQHHRCRGGQVRVSAAGDVGEVIAVNSQPPTPNSQGESFENQSPWELGVGELGVDAVSVPDSDSH